VRKEQLLLVGCAAIGALLVFTSTGKYAEVGAAGLTFSSPTSVAIVSAVQPDPVKGLSAEPLKGRSLSQLVRTEKRPALPPLEGPPQPPFWWVRLITWPGPGAGAWGVWKGARGQIVVVKQPTEDPNKPAAPDKPDTPVEPPKPAFDPAKAAKMIRTGGEEVLVRFELTGAFKGQPDWVILEKWPNVTFKVHNLKKENGSELGAYDATPELIQSTTAVFLAKTLENEYWEERIKRHVKDDDHDALVALAKWTFDTLPSHVGIDKMTGIDDKAPYGIAAVRLAIADQTKAVELVPDLAGTKALVEYCRAGFDLDGQIRAWRKFLASGHANDNSALIAVGEELERLGALDAAKANYLKAAQSGDSNAKLRAALVDEREGLVDAAAEELKPLVGVAGVGARAAMALGRIALAQGKIEEAAAYAEQAKKDGSGVELNLLLGSVQYAQAKYADAEKSFAAAREDDAHSAWLSNRGMALVGKGTLPDLDEAKKAFNTCLDKDPMNLLDPLFGLGDAYQRLGDVQHSNDFFETALARSPDNPWILLRMATIKLRDGQPDKALELGMHLLDVAPECDDALWLVGRAAASLSTPDLEKAVTHLRRAVDKEGDNHEFTNEYARALLAAGRVEEAIKVLDAATDVNKGFARSDARMLALAAWARFLGKRPVSPDVLDAIQRGQRATPDDATKDWLESTKKALIEWDHTRVWQDDFDRPPSSNVGNNWREQENLGIGISIDAGHAVFKSQNVKNAAPTRQGATVLDRDEDLGRFKQMQSSFKTCQGVETTFGLHLGPPAERDPKKGRSAFEVAIGCDRNGFMEVWAQVGKEASAKPYLVKDAAGNPRPWPMDDYHTVKIIRKDDVRGVFEIWLDDEQITLTTGTAEKPVTTSRFESQSLNAQPGKMFALGFIVDADAGAMVDVAVDMVQVTKIYK
jgi:tetratricopeptide (TPR) repeat protein